MAKSGIDHLKRYTINGPANQINQESIMNVNMKKSSINLKYNPPPSLSYETKQNNPSIEQNLNELGTKNSSSNSNLHLNSANGRAYLSKIAPKHKT